ncbi:hypothetical protein PIB30_099760, partial [Stylosanthes scabra]|nr:hypothetical protein [Stylosanthes scabra]
MAEIPALFYKFYKQELNDKAIFNDDAGNDIEVQLEKGERTAVIVKGLANIVYVYGLSLGGWLKVLYMGDDHFYTVKVMDQNMTSKEVECFPCRFYIDMKPPYASLNGKANTSPTPTFEQSTNLPTPLEVEEADPAMSPTYLSFFQEFFPNECCLISDGKGPPPLQVPLKRESCRAVFYSTIK